MSINDCDEEEVLHAILNGLRVDEFQHLELDSRSVLSLANLTLYPSFLQVLTDNSGNDSHGHTTFYIQSGGRKAVPMLC